MKTVLIVTDFSEAARKALRYAVDFLQESGFFCHVILLNTYLVPSLPASRLVAANDEIKKKSFETLKKESKMVQALVKDGKITLEILTQMGSLESVMAHLAETKKVDLAIMAMNGPKSRDDIQGVMRRLSCPLLIVPA